MQDALEGERAQLAETTTAADPEMVAVFDLAGTVDGFLRACQGIDGLEFLADLQEDLVDADEDFFYDGEDDASDDGVPQSLYMVMSNAQAVAELVRLFELWQEDTSVTFETGLNPLKQVFGLLRAIRRWESSDRVRETGLLADWEDTVAAAGNSASARVEVELWFRSDAASRAAAEASVAELIGQAGGEVLQRSTIAEIDYHGLLADIPYAQVQAVVERGPDAIELLKAESVMFVTPARPMAFPAAPPTQFGLGGLDTDRPSGLPRVALLDGAPMANHLALDGRLVVDDPDELGASYPTRQRAHGTAMAALIAHGDLSAPGQAARRPIYVRPILEPHPWVAEVEQVVADELLVDLVHRCFRRMFDGDGQHPPTAPSVRVINLSIGDPARMFIRRLSPLAKLLDWIAHSYNVVVVVSAGNHNAVPTVTAGALGDIDLLREAAARSHHAALRHRRLLSPAEAVNALTVGAQHTDAAVTSAPDTVIDAYQPDGPAGYSGSGFGFRRSVKPEVLMPGGRQLFQWPPPGSTVLNHAPTEATGPGIQVAAPGLAGQQDGTVFTFGSSNAAALASRAIDQIFETLEGLVDVPDEFPFPDAQYHPVLAKALLVHAASWGDIGTTLSGQLGLDPQRRRRELTQLLGYGAVDGERLARAERVRPVLLGAGSITKDKRHTFRFPLPTGLSASGEWRRLTVTLAWLSQVNTRSQKHRMARLAIDVPRTDLAVRPIDADHNAVAKGTVEHQVLEGQAIVGIVAGSTMEVSVDCRVDAGRLDAAVRYGLVASLEVGPAVRIDLHEEVRQGLRAQVRVRARQQVNVR